MNYETQRKFWNQQIGDDGQEQAQPAVDQQAQPAIDPNNLSAADRPAQPTIQNVLDNLLPVSRVQYAQRIQNLIAQSITNNIQQLIRLEVLAATPTNNKSFWVALCLALNIPQPGAESVAQYFSEYVVERNDTDIVEQYITRLMHDDDELHFDYVSNLLGDEKFAEYEQIVTIKANVAKIAAAAAQTEAAAAPAAPAAAKAAKEAAAAKLVKAAEFWTDETISEFAYAIGAINATFRTDMHGEMYTVKPVVEFVKDVLEEQEIYLFVYDNDNDMTPIIGAWPKKRVGLREMNTDRARCICLLMTGDELKEHYNLIKMPTAQAVPRVIMGGAMQDFKRAKLLHNTSAKHDNYENMKPIDIDTAYGNQRQLKDTNELRGGVTHRIAKHTKHTKHAEPVRSGAVGLYKSAVAAWRHACMITSQPTSPFARFSKHCRPTDMTDFEKYVDWAYRHVVLQGLAMPTELAGKHDKLVAKYVGADLSANLVLKECRTLVVEIMAGKAVFRYLATTDVPTFCWLVSPGLYKLASQVFSNNSNHSDYSDQTSQARWLAKQAKTTKLFDRQDHKAGPTELVQTKQLVSTNKHAGQLPVLWLDKSTSQTKQTKQTEETVHDFKRAKHAHPNHTSHKWQAVLYCQDRKAVSSQLAFANQSKAAQLPNLAAMLAKMPGFFWKDLLGWQSKQIDFELLAKLVMIG